MTGVGVLSTGDIVLPRKHYGGAPHTPPVCWHSLCSRWRSGCPAGRWPAS
jgi:hypothetical protein